ncbi:VWA domain-containing protein [Brevibacterium sp. JSBI002]|uniref:VWA domain-containing protein n=1 Tax=Brevibacterium sp. JSBI002 TaxID=2886045 RepID=UPI0022316DDD|nr:VWA domain-containing protein [Brevibacterium sp. JSBI002]UZD62196.1 VWA domain-containing protein [Brevibacterium sp. JSBI002]
MTNLADTLILLSARLRAAGLPADMEAVRSLLTAAASLDPFDPRQIRAASRSLTCTRHEHLRIHDAVFDSTFGLRVAGAAEDSGIQVEIPQPHLSLDGAGEAESAEITAASRRERLRHVDLGLDDTAEAAALIDRLTFGRPLGSPYRSRPWHAGDIDSRRMLRQLVRAEELSSIPRRRSLHRLRQVTLVADVSASMSPWRESVLRFLDRGADQLRARCFTAGTRLTRVDRPHASANTRSGRGRLRTGLTDVLDAGSGTRLGDSLGELLTGRRKDLVRGSVLVVISDGWEQGDCAELERSCARLARLSHRFLWVNPRAGRAGFAARTRGLSVAAVHAHAVLPATTVAQWQVAADAIAARAQHHGERSAVRGGSEVRA